MYEYVLLSNNIITHFLSLCFHNSNVVCVCVCLFQEPAFCESPSCFGSSGHPWFVLNRTGKTNFSKNTTLLSFNNDCNLVWFFFLKRAKKRKLTSWKKMSESIYSKFCMKGKCYISVKITAFSGLFALE